jgi:hypothetical protein
MQLLLRWMKVVRIAGDDPSVDEPGNDFLPANVWRSCRPRNMNFATHCAAGELWAIPRWPFQPRQM